MNGVLIFLSITMAAFAASLLPPMLVSATLDEGFVADYLVIFGLILFLAGGIYLAVHGRPLNIGRVGSYALLLAAWVILPATASLPYLLIGNLPPVDAVFEAVSGLTTTGATVLSSVNEIPRSLVLWRSLTPVAGRVPDIAFGSSGPCSGRNRWVAGQTHQADRTRRTRQRGAHCPHNWCHRTGVHADQPDLPGAAHFQRRSADGRGLPDLFPPFQPAASCAGWHAISLCQPAGQADPSRLS